jgi:hypothetical protein
MTGIPSKLLSVGLTLLAAILVATPLALWVAWTGPILFGVLAAGLAAAVLYCLLARLELPAVASPSRTAALRPEPLPDELVDEIQRLHPFVHHNRFAKDRAFRAAMRRLKLHLYGKPE